MTTLVPALLLNILSPRPRVVRITDVIEGKVVQLFTIEKSKKTIPPMETVSYEEIISGLQAGTIVVPGVDAYQVLPRPLDENLRGKKYAKRREIEEKKDREEQAAFEMVSWIITIAGPDLHIKSIRRAVYRAASEKFNKDLTVVKRTMGRFYRGGMTSTAVRPDYNGAGRPKDSPSTKKPGRNPEAGAKVDATMRHHIKTWFAYKYNPTTTSLREACELFLAECAKSGLELPDENDEIKVRLIPRHLRPNPASILYYYYRDSSEIERLRKRYDEKEIGRNHRPVTGSAITPIYGPGSRFEADFTISPFPCVGLYYPEKYIGKPVIGVVWDVYSGAAVGLLVTWENASAMQLRMLVANTMSDKVEFCARYGKRIKPEDWPMMHTPKMWVVDRGEGRGYVGNDIVKATNTTLKNLAVERPDLKSVVESAFAKLKRKGKFLPGAEPIFAKDGKDDAPKNARLNIKQLTLAIIEILLEHNHTVDLERPLSLPSLKMKEPATPTNIWNRGILARSGLLRYEPDSQAVKRKVLPRVNGVLRFNGIAYKGIHYQNPSIENLQSAQRRTHRRIDREIILGETIDEIYLQLDPKKPEILTLSASGEAALCKGLTFSEWTQIKSKRRTKDRQHNESRTETRINTRRRIAALTKGAIKVTNAARKVAGLRPGQVDDKDRRESRKAEALKLRQEELVRSQKGNASMPANVVQANFGNKSAPAKTSVKPKLDPSLNKYAASWED